MVIPNMARKPSHCLEIGLSTAANSILTQSDDLAVRAAELKNEFHPVAEFATQLHKKIACQLPPLQKLSYKIDIITASSCMLTSRVCGDVFKQEISNKINCQEISGNVCRAEEDTEAVVMFTQGKGDSTYKLRFLLHCRQWNTVTIKNHSSLSNIQ